MHAIWLHEHINIYKVLLCNEVHIPATDTFKIQPVLFIYVYTLNNDSQQLIREKKLSRMLKYPLLQK